MITFTWLIFTNDEINDKVWVVHYTWRRKQVLVKE